MPDRGQRFLTARAWWSLAITSRRLKAHGFAETYALYSRLAKPLDEPDDSGRVLARACSAFSRAENAFLLKEAPRDCLPRSLALFGLLRSLGLAAEHVIGVQLFPFQAHAWVEHRGRVVHDDPSHPSRFAPIARISS
jgi:hypothetical protein